MKTKSRAQKSSPKFVAVVELEIQHTAKIENKSCGRHFIWNKHRFNGDNVENQPCRTSYRAWPRSEM